MVCFLSLQLFYKCTGCTLESCNTVQTCFGHVHKRNRTSIQFALLNKSPLLDVNT